MSLSDQLRDAGNAMFDKGRTGQCQLLFEAADTIASLTAERDDHKRARKLLATDLKALQDGTEVVTALAAGVEERIKQLTAERDGLVHYREQVECAHGARLYAVDNLLEHFNADGTLKGNGQWRLAEIYRSVKEFDESSRLSSQLAEFKSPAAELRAERDGLRDAAINARAELQNHDRYEYGGINREVVDCIAELDAALAAVNESK